MKLGKFIKPVVSLFCICLAASLLLGLSNELTADRIAEAAAKAELEQRAAVLPAAAYYIEKDGYFEGYDKEGGTFVGYIAVTSAKGYGGDVKVMTGFGADKKIAAVVILEHSETQGVGSKTDSPSFLGQFAGLSGSAKLGENIDAVSGATRSSTAVTNAVNMAVEIIKGIGGALK